MSEDQQPDVAAKEAADEEPDLDRGVVEAWAARMISNPERAYRAGFYTATIFFIVTTLFPFFWLFVIAVTPRSNLSDIGVFGDNPLANSSDSFVIVLVADIWKTSAFMALLILAGLQIGRAHV